MLSWTTTAATILLSGYLARPLPLPLCITVAGLLLLHRFKRGRSQYLGLLLAVATGLVYASLYTEYRLDRMLPYELEGQNLRLQLKIISQPQRRDGERPAYRFDARVVSLHDCGSKSCPSHLGKLRLNYYGEQSLENGDQLSAVVRLKRPRGYLSKGAFDYGRWLFASGYSASGYIRQLEQAPIAAEASALPWRESALASLKYSLADYENRDVMLALTFGDTSGLSVARWQQLAATGTSHLLAISGMHIGLVAFWGYLLGRLLGGLCPSSAVAICLPPIMAMVVGLVYGAMAGFALPTQRALIMLASLCTAQLGLRKIVTWYGLSLALLGVAILDPLAAHKPGFYLSFGAVFLLFWRFQGFRSNRRKHKLMSFFADLFHAQWLLGLGLLPLLLAWQFPLAPLSMPANLIAIPIVAFLTLPLLLVSYVLSLLGFGAAALGWQLADWALHYLFLALDVLQGLAGPSTVAASGTAILAALVGVVVLMRRGLPGKGLALMLIMALLLSSDKPPSVGHYTVRVLDVGQGLAVLVSTAKHHLLFDTGPDFDGGFNTVDAVVLPALRQLGVNHLDALVLSHNDRDHIGAVAPLLKRVTVAQVYRGEKIEGTQPLGESCHQQQSWQWDGVDFRFISTPTSATKEGNGASCVLQLGTSDGRSLIPGDISSLEESELRRVWQQSLQSTLLVAPHHGSKTSSSEAFVAVVAPAIIVFSSGYKHAYGHPADIVMERYRRVGSTCWHTGSQGSIAVEISPKGIVSSQPWRRAYYYWEQPENTSMCGN